MDCHGRNGAARNAFDVCNTRRRPLCPSSTYKSELLKRPKLIIAHSICSVLVNSIVIPRVSGFHHFEVIECTTVELDNF